MKVNAYSDIVVCKWIDIMMGMAKNIMAVWSCMCIEWLTVYACSILRVSTYPAPEQGSGILFSSESVHDLRVGERHLAMSLYKLKAYDIPKLNYIPT